MPNDPFTGVFMVEIYWKDALKSPREPTDE